MAPRIKSYDLVLRLLRHLAALKAPRAIDLATILSPAERARLPKQSVDSVVAFGSYVNSRQRRNSSACNHRAATKGAALKGTPIEVIIPNPANGYYLEQFIDETKKGGASENAERVKVHRDDKNIHRCGSQSGRKRRIPLPSLTVASFRCSRPGQWKGDDTLSSETGYAADSYQRQNQLSKRRRRARHVTNSPSCRS